MAVFEDRIRSWCEEESLSMVAERDDQATFACSISMSGEPPVVISARAPASQPNRLLLAHTFEPAAAAGIAGRSNGKEQITTFLEGVTAGRSGLVECRLAEGEKVPVAEVAVTLHEDGISKHGFLSALAEIRKVRRVVEWGLEAMSVAEGVVEDFEGVAREAEALSSQVQQAAESVEELAAAAEATPPPPEPASAEAAPAGRFCPSCGRQAKPEHRFCIGCGTPLEG